MKKRILALLLATMIFLAMPVTALGEYGGPGGGQPPYPPLIEARIALPDFDCD